MIQRAELEYEGWRLSVAPQGPRFAWWVISQDADHSTIKRGDSATMDAALHEAHRTLQAQLGRPVPKPTLLETP